VTAMSRIKNILPSWLVLVATLGAAVLAEELTGAVWPPLMVLAIGSLIFFSILARRGP